MAVLRNTLFLQMAKEGAQFTDAYAASRLLQANILTVNIRAGSMLAVQRFPYKVPVINFWPHQPDGFIAYKNSIIKPPST